MNKFDVCYNVSKMIIDKYVEFLYTPLYAIDAMKHNEIINEIKILVLEEYKILHSMTLDEINFYLEQEYSENNGYDMDIIPRVINKLTASREILLGKVISANELNLYIFDDNIEFSIYDSILSMINIEVIKLLKKKIYSLNATCSGDVKFINLLKQKLKLSKIQLLFNSSLSEMLTLYNNTGIDETPSVDIDAIKNKLDKFNNNAIKNVINNILDIVADKNFYEVINTCKINNNCDDVFWYLEIVTMIEVVVSYMDKKMIEKYYGYCCEMSDENNKYSVENIKKILKKRIDN